MVEGMQVLMVEDDKLSARLAAQLFSAGGVDVRSVADIEVAWCLLREEGGADLLVLDNQVEKSVGHELLGWVRSDPLLSRQPVIVYSAALDRPTVTTYMRLGVQNVLLKPYQKEVLLREWERARQTEWRMVPYRRLWQSIAAQGVNENEYASVLAELHAIIMDCAAACESFGRGVAVDPPHTKLNCLCSLAVNLELSRLREIADDIRAAVSADFSYDKILAGVDGLRRFATWLEKRPQAA